MTVFRRNMQPFGVGVSIIEPGFFKTNVTRLDVIEADLRRLWSRLPQGVRDSYGPAYFDDCECESRLSGDSSATTSNKRFRRRLISAPPCRCQGSGLLHGDPEQPRSVKGDLVHGARPDGEPPAHALLRGLGRQTPVDPPVLPPLGRV